MVCVFITVQSVSSLSLSYMDSVLYMSSRMYTLTRIYILFLVYSLSYLYSFNLCVLRPVSVYSHTSVSTPCHLSVYSIAIRLLPTHLHKTDVVGSRYWQVNWSAKALPACRLTLSTHQYRSLDIDLLLSTISLYLTSDCVTRCNTLRGASYPDESGPILIEVRIWFSLESSLRTRIDTDL